MSIRETIAILASAALLLVAAWAIHAYQLWSLLGNFTVPWLLSSVAVGLLVVVSISALTGRHPSELGPRVGRLVTAGLSLGIGIGMLVDSVAYRSRPVDWRASVAEWIGFTVILAFLFWIPRAAGSKR